MMTEMPPLPVHSPSDMLKLLEARETPDPWPGSGHPPGGSRRDATGEDPPAPHTRGPSIPRAGQTDRRQGRVRPFVRIGISQSLTSYA